MDTLLVFYTPRHTPNYPANDSVQKAQNKCIPARKVKKDKLQMNQGKATLKEIISLFFWKKKQRISRTTKVQQFYLFAIFVPPQNIGCLSDEDSIFTQEDIQAVWSHHPGILCTVLGHQHPPPPPHGRLLCSGLLPEHLQCFFIRMLKAGAKRPSTDSSPFLFSYYFGMVEQFHRHRWKYPLKISQVTKFESNLSVDNLDLQSHKI